MPELPEVETVVADLLAEELVGAQIGGVVSFWPGSLAEPSAAEFAQQIVGQKIAQIERRGKYICLKIGTSTLLIHLRMSGRLLVDRSEALSLHERIRFFLSDGRLLKFIDQRKFGRMYWLKDPAARLKQLGPDPLLPSFHATYLHNRLKRKLRIKTLLLDQRVIAGIGNIYADEALWEAKIHPETRADTLSLIEVEALCLAIQKVLAKAIANRGTSLGAHPSNFHSATGARGKNAAHLVVYHRAGSPCPRCHTPIVRSKIQGRSTHYCPFCQKE